jgi:hypothetical protein
MRTRKLSKEFMDAFRSGGKLFPILKWVQEDDTLDLEIRDDYVNIYYRGGNLIRITRKNDSFEFFFDQEYDKSKKLQVPLPTAKVTDWIEKIPAIKEAMDKYFTAHKKEEREFQQLVVRENNNSSIANSTDYFIIDIEYDNQAEKSKSRFDLIALKWESDGSIRKNQKGTPCLAFIEMKYSKDALAGTSGMANHLKGFQEYVKEVGKLVIIKEMTDIFAQKRMLNLIPSLKHNKNPIAADAISEDFEYIFLLANHNPESSKLAKELDNIATLLQNRALIISPKFCVANFMGYGLYKENIYTLEDFRKRFERQICSKPAVSLAL